MQSAWWDPTGNLAGAPDKKRKADNAPESDADKNLASEVKAMIKEAATVMHTELRMTG